MSHTTRGWARQGDRPLPRSLAHHTRASQGVRGRPGHVLIVLVTPPPFARATLKFLISMETTPAIDPTQARALQEDTRGDCRGIDVPVPLLL